MLSACAKAFIGFFIKLCVMFFISASICFALHILFHSLHIILISQECYLMLLMFLLFLLFAAIVYRDVSIKLLCQQF